MISHDRKRIVLPQARQKWRAFSRLMQCMKTITRSGQAWRGYERALWGEMVPIAQFSRGGQVGMCRGCAAAGRCCGVEGEGEAERGRSARGRRERLRRSGKGWPFMG